MSHTIELVYGVEGTEGVRIDGTLYSAAQVAEALRVQPHYTALARACNRAVAVADACRAVRSQLAEFDRPPLGDPAIRSLLGACDDAEAQAWAELATLVEGGAR